MSFIPTQHRGLVKDTETKAVINTDINEYKKILDKRNHRKQMQNVQHQIDDLKGEFTELKKLIIQLINGRV